MTERYCVRVADLPRFRVLASVPCADCGAPVVHNEPDPADVRFICMQCLTSDPRPDPWMYFKYQGRR